MREKIRTTARLAAMGSLLLAAGCTETSFPEATGEGTIRGVHGIVDLAEVTFRIEELSLGSVEYKASSATAPYDNLNYTFNFDLPVPNQSAPRRLASRNVDVADGRDYLFVLAGTSQTPEIFLWEREIREWTEEDTTFEVEFGHADPGFGGFDVYFAAEGTTPVAGNAIGTLAYGDRLDAVEFEAGDYQVILTAPGDPATVLYQSITVTYPAAQSFTLALFEADPGISGPASLRRIGPGGGSTGNLADERFSPTAQFVHASFGTGNIDIAVNGDFANPLVTNLGYGEVSPDVDAVAGTATYQIVPTGNTMSLFDLETSLGAGGRTLIQLIGTPSELLTLQGPSVRRGVTTVSQVRFTNAVTNIDALDVYIREPGTDINEVPPSIFGATLGFSSFSNRVAGNYELTVTEGGEKTVVGGPVQVSFPLEDVIEVILLDTADPNAVDLLVFSAVNP